jgi:ribonuclease P protein component
MLATPYRIKESRDFKIVTTDGRRVDRPWYTVFVYDRADDGYPRFGFVISTRISKLATQRNRLKRVFEDTVRYNVKDFPKGLDLVFLVKTSITKIITDDIQKDINNLFANTDFERVVYRR